MQCLNFCTINHPRRNVCYQRQGFEYCSFHAPATSCILCAKRFGMSQMSIVFPMIVLVPFLFVVGVLVAASSREQRYMLLQDSSWQLALRPTFLVSFRLFKPFLSTTSRYCAGRNMRQEHAAGLISNAACFFRSPHNGHVSS